MQVQALGKIALKPNLQASLLETESRSIVPSLLEAYKSTDIESARVALTEAERVIRAQEERISQLENLAITDELTGLLNRRGFTLALHRELSFARRDQNAKGILVLVDLDNFKSINDLWGHGAGDDYLQAVAHALLSEVRANDIVARIGGDEFAILLTRMDENLGALRLNKLVKSFNSRLMHWQDKVLPLRASFGLSVYEGTDQPEAIMAAADLKLYAAKSKRRAARG